MTPYQWQCKLDELQDFYQSKSKTIYLYIYIYTDYSLKPDSLPQDTPHICYTMIFYVYIFSLHNSKIYPLIIWAQLKFVYCNIQWNFYSKSWLVNKIYLNPTAVILCYFLSYYDTNMTSTDIAKSFIKSVYKANLHSILNKSYLLSFC